MICKFGVILLWKGWMLWLTHHPNPVSSHTLSQMWTCAQRAPGKDVHIYAVQDFRSMSLEDMMDMGCVFQWIQPLYIGNACSEFERLKTIRPNERQRPGPLPRAKSTRPNHQVLGRKRWIRKTMAPGSPDDPWSSGGRTTDARWLR